MSDTHDELDSLDEELVSEEVKAAESQAEDDALIKVFINVRKRSRLGYLVQPNDWVELGFVPSHLDAEDFEMYVFAYLEEYLHQKELEATEKPVTVFRTASTVVGVPPMFSSTKSEPKNEGELAESERMESGLSGSELPEGELPEGELTEGELSEGELPEGAGEGSDKEQPDQSKSEDKNIPPGFELVELEGELTLVPLEEDESERYPDCHGITFLIGKTSYYLYDKEIMTEAYARWAFLAAEDDRITTFVECVRNESKTYPRPMPLTGLQNEPFSFTADEINEIWQAVSESSNYPDIQKTVASNGAVYFFSADHLSSGYAATLAEWEAVERSSYM